MPIDLKAAVAPKAREAAYPALKASIVLFDCNPGTRSWTVPEGVSQIRAFVVGAGSSATSSVGGAGGGYSEKIIDVTTGQVISYTVGAPSAPGATTPAGTSAFGGIISATGGSTTEVGQGSGGDINTEGGPPNSGASNGAGSGAGHAFGNGQQGAANVRGGGFSDGSRSFVDGWKIGVVPGDMNYGLGGVSSGAPIQAGMGGGAGHSQSPAGIGGGASGATISGGPGLVGIEVIA